MSNASSRNDATGSSITTDQGTSGKKTFLSSSVGPLRKLARYFLIGLPTAVLILYFLSTHFVINQTPSIPTGIYSLQSSTSFQPGDYVVSCLPGRTYDLVLERGYLQSSRTPTSKCYPMKVPPLIKRIQAVPGDTVIVRKTLPVVVRHVGKDDNVSSYRVAPTPLTRDTDGRPMQPAYGMHVLSEGEYWIGSTYHNGFDSRYFGAVDQHLFYSSARPFWTSTRQPWSRNHDSRDPSTFTLPRPGSTSAQDSAGPNTSVRRFKSVLH